VTNSVEVPSSVITEVRNRWPHVGRDWAQQVLVEFDDLCSRYRATPVRVLPARFGFVVAVETRDGRIVMRSTPDPAGPAQGAVAKDLAGYGVAPQVHDVFTTDAGTWTIMDEVVPGVSLADADRSTVRPQTVVDMFRRITDQPAPRATGMQGIGEWLRDRLTSHDLVDLPIGQTAAPDGQRRQAVALLDGLVATGAPGLVCHGDSYPGNVLVGADGKLFWIDPRGVTGEVGYDVAVFCLKASRHVVSAARAMAAQLAEQVGTDVNRAQEWVVVASAARV
jgi:streptomycin 6-kinase